MNFVQHALCALLPRRHLQLKSGFKFTQSQPGIVRTRCRQWIRFGGNCPDLVSRYLQRNTIALGMLQNKPGKTVPRRLASSGQVINASQRRRVLITQHPAQNVRCHIGNELGTGRRAMLISHYIERVALGRQAQHGLGKVIALRRIHPTGAQNQRLGTAGLNGLLAHQLAAAVDRQWAGRCVFLPLAIAAAIEHVISRIMNQPGAKRCGFPSQHAGCLAVDQQGHIRLAFSFVHSGISRCVDDNVGGQRTNRGGQALKVGKVPTQAISALTIQRNHLTQRCQRTLQLPTNLSVLAQQQNLHASATSYCCTIQSR
ncbi:Acyl-CoA dehydrogenase related to the alkylation response protein AidB [Pseudomonas syringae pv. actinidiae]|uniref:Acyl-CoA dehydrogenase related to the alkylation response protein AidB n=1 Tax=Pseudomonas syringae pv. actinidiae TaxID=103796 RepID=A0AAN4TNA6_PSESF|nr:Acyl-CoA dehydrogenase related to the alkylation response protein AidB [Pseudomonas syringae pv. actinidiae]